MSLPAFPISVLLPLSPAIVSLLAVPITVEKLVTPKVKVGTETDGPITKTALLKTTELVAKLTLIVAVPVAVEASIMLVLPVAPIIFSTLTSWSVPAVPLVTTPVCFRVIA
jgi:hypothetical protein